MRIRSALIAVAAITATGYILKRLSETAKIKAADESLRHQNESIDEAIGDSFPASDPPSWTGGGYH